VGFLDLVAAADRAAQDLLGGVTVSYAPEVREAVEVQGMFDERYVLVQASAHAGVEQTAPAVFLRLEDLPADPDDDEPLITIGAKTYRVRERQRDGLGGIRLLLHLADPEES